MGETVIKTAEESATGTANELIDPVLQHAERINSLESGMTAQEERLNNRIIDLEAQLRTAIEQNAATDKINAIEERLASTERKLEEASTHPVETTETGTGAAAEVPGQAATFVVKEVEESPKPPEKERRSIRHRRKNRRTKK